MAEHPAVRGAVTELATQGVPVITLISDLSNSPRVAYIGLDNRAAGRTAGYLIGRASSALAARRWRSSTAASMQSSLKARTPR